MKKMLVFAAAALWLTIGVSSAADPPELKEGLWSIHYQSIDNPGNKKSESTSTICRNHAYDKSAEALAKNVKGCTKVTESFQDGKYSTELHCVVAGTTIETKGTATYQGDTSTHSESHTTYTPAFYGMSESTMTTDQKYVGSCPAGAQPGDRTTADGKVTRPGKH
jgi:hypothetical protein